jgi:4a-hydroxytetrahydrobiopterin dehydratase
MDDAITAREFHADETLADWRVLSDGATAYFATASYAESAALVRAIADIPEVAEHPPAVDIRVTGVTVRLLTYTDDYYGMSQRDVVVGQRISAVARDMGLSADPSAMQSLLIIPGAPDSAAIIPFWRAALGYEPRMDSPDEDLVDPGDRLPAFWFERMNEPRPDGGGAIHVAVWLPPGLAEARVEAALAAGGRIVRDVAPSWWTLADAAGNEIDISSIQGRD